jgi:ABC-type polar amino acid transport system ATPase subunit
MLHIKNLCKSYNGKKILDKLDLTLLKGEIGILNGPSGSGKSTLLECIADLADYDAGTISIESKSLPKVGFVFQSYELFPNYDAISNIMLPLILVKKTAQDIALKEAKKLLEMMDLSGKEDTYIDNLSGGEKQRVAIARALGLCPPLLLLDEPTAALDRKNSIRLAEIFKSLAHNGTSFLIATHDNDFILDLQKGNATSVVIFSEH